MNQINLSEINIFTKIAMAPIGSYLGKVIVVIQANPVAVVVAIIAIAALIIGIKCYKAYTSLNLENIKLTQENTQLKKDIEDNKLKINDESEKSKVINDEFQALKEQNEKLLKEKINIDEIIKRNETLEAE